MVDKVRAKLCNWDTRKLSVAGRLTLAQPILLAMPNYFMQAMQLPKGVCDEIERLVRKFIWGSSIGSRKITLMDWATICQPRDRGGLGIRKLQDQNKSFLLKIELSLVTKKDELWVKVLRSKHRLTENIPDTITRNCCSSLRQTIMKIWPSLKENISWVVGNGSEVDCWSDNWIPSLGPLANHLKETDSPIPNMMLEDMVCSNGTWNLDEFRKLLPEEIVRIIIDQPPPKTAGGPNRIRWSYGSNGDFSIKSAYKQLVENSWNVRDTSWKEI